MKGRYLVLLNTAAAFGRRDETMVKKLMKTAMRTSSMVMERVHAETRKTRVGRAGGDGVYVGSCCWNRR